MHFSTKNLAISALAIAGVVTAAPAKGANYPVKLLGAQTPTKYMHHQARAVPLPVCSPNWKFEKPDPSDVLSDPFGIAAAVSEIDLDPIRKKHCRPDGTWIDNPDFTATSVVATETSTTTPKIVAKAENEHNPSLSEIIRDTTTRGLGLYLPKKPERSSDESHQPKGRSLWESDCYRPMRISELKCREFEYSNSAKCSKIIRGGDHPEEFELKGRFTTYKCEPSEPAPNFEPSVTDQKYDFFCQQDPPNTEHPHGDFAQFKKSKEVEYNYCLRTDIPEATGKGYCGTNLPIQLIELLNSRRHKFVPTDCV